MHPRFRGRFRTLRYNLSKARSLEAARKRSSTMDEPDIYARLRDIFEDIFDDDPIVVTPTLPAKDVDGWDSLTHIRLILAVEKAFKVRFSTSEIGRMETVGDLVTLIKAGT